jgi:NAD(P)-dependent dehydrogenase (short-subunit alcohol dehydrogenase family)
MTMRTAVVTGAASGIGRACTSMLLAAGYRVTGIDLRGHAIQNAFPDAGASLHALSADVGDVEQCRNAMDSAAAALGHIDALLHFAAVWTGKTWDQTEPGEWERVLRVNGIRVNGINPGVVQTAMTASWPAAVKEKAIELTPLGRLAEPDDISRASPAFWPPSNPAS